MKGLLRVAADLQAFFEGVHWHFCFIGGIALQRWGEPRLTIDVDVSLLTGVGTEQRFIDRLLTEYKPRIPNAADFALQSRVLLLEGPDEVGLDIALAAFPFEQQVIERAAKADFIDEISLLICSAEDLIVLKAFANRPRDWADVQGILRRQAGALDVDYIKENLKGLCELRESPEILDGFLHLLQEEIRRR